MEKLKTTLISITVMFVATLFIVNALAMSYYFDFRSYSAKVEVCSDLYLNNRTNMNEIRLVSSYEHYAAAYEEYSIIKDFFGVLIIFPKIYKKELVIK